jgi:hypothetical protein
MDLNLSINTQDIQTSFYDIADDLMNNWVLVANDHTYRIAEIEFYFKDPASHEDSFTHGHALQKESGKWYLHGSGLDITFGTKDCHGGILIRALQGMDSPGSYTYGPINCLTELFKNIGSVYKGTTSFGLEKDTQKRIAVEKPIAAPRVGLNETKDPAMHAKLYRFLVLPANKHANKTIIADAMKQQGYTEEEVKAIWR